MEWFGKIKHLAHIHNVQWFGNIKHYRRTDTLGSVHKSKIKERVRRSCSNYCSNPLFSMMVPRLRIRNKDYNKCCNKKESEFETR